MLCDAPSSAAYDVCALGGVVEDPVHEAGAVETVGPVCAGGGAACRPDLGALPPSGICAEDKRFAAPEVCDLYSASGRRQGRK